MYAISWVQMTDTSIDIGSAGVMATYSTIYLAQGSAMDHMLGSSRVVSFAPPSSAQLAALATERHEVAAAPTQAQLPQRFDVHMSLARSYRSNTEVASP
ncbi:hypothetical protein HDC36_000527 [Xanthomonas sp. JAI131]|uniref:hypothetical protein n=1 Tax=Xanthomonas sp. JAI131 TaxID=2723067 RepID=UPI0015CBDA30|nr:hypothetical protein [Xanthomonas sp. JAI131]NYF19090.1 hypothetical protein [Xanthomonas sp. JAI131]